MVTSRHMEDRQQYSDATELLTKYNSTVLIWHGSRALDHQRAPVEVKCLTHSALVIQ